MSSEERSSTASVNLFTPITHPVLKSVDPVKVSTFLKEREAYEFEVLEKQKELPTLTLAPYTSCIDRTLLKHMIMLGELDDIAPDKTADQLTSEEVETFITGLVTKPQSGYDPECIEKALKDFRMPMHIADPSARVLRFASCLFERLEEIGYGEFCADNPEKATELMCKHLQPQKLRDVMTARIDFDKSLKKNVKSFVKLIRTEAVSCQTYSSNISENSNYKIHRGAASTDKAKATHEKHPKKPVCLFAPHNKKGLRHLLRDCRACPESEKAGLIEKFKAHKVSKTPKQGAKRVSEPIDNLKNIESSITFAATFGDKLHERLMADIGADANLAYTALIQRVHNAGGTVETENRVRPIIFSLAVGEGRDGKSIDVVCKKTALLNVELHVRNGCTLMLRNLKRMLTDEQMPEPLLGRPTLEILGLNTKEILAAAADRLHGDIDMSSVLSTDPSDCGGGTIARVLQEGIYHSEGGVDGSCPDLDEDWLDFGDDNPSEKREAVEAMLSPAAKNGISNSGLQSLRDLTEEFDDVLRLRLGPGPPAKIEPLKIELIDDARTVRIKQRHYPPARRSFMNRVVSKLDAYNMIKKTTDADWIAAPLIVPKPPPANFRFTVHLQPIHAATKLITWPMPNMESEMEDMRDSRCYASIDFPSSFWQAPMHEESQSLHSFMTDSGVYKPTRTLQGGGNSAQNFQGKVFPCFSELQYCLKALIDDFALHTPTEQQLVTS